MREREERERIGEKQVARELVLAESEEHEIRGQPGGRAPRGLEDEVCRAAAEGERHEWRRRREQRDRYTRSEGAKLKPVSTQGLHVPERSMQGVGGSRLGRKDWPG